MSAKRAELMRHLPQSPAWLRALAAPAIAILLSVAAPAALTQNPAQAASAASLSTGFAFSEAGGEDLYASACQGCHMSDGKGAVGAGTYPSLAGDKALEAAGYPVYIVVHGRHAMPPVGYMMSDDQVAAVVNYVRTHFGNDYRDAVTAADVKAVRPAAEDLPPEMRRRQ
jgi:mono/diheme cytochrome c family protein